MCFYHIVSYSISKKFIWNVKLRNLHYRRQSAFQTDILWNFIPHHKNVRSYLQALLSVKVGKKASILGNYLCLRCTFDILFCPSVIRLMYKSSIYSESKSIQSLQSFFPHECNQLYVFFTSVYIYCLVVMSMHLCLVHLYLWCVLLDFVSSKSQKYLTTIHTSHFIVFPLQLRKPLKKHGYTKSVNILFDQCVVLFLAGTKTYTFLYSLLHPGSTICLCSSDLMKI